jgi:hypothetical protein
LKYLVVSVASGHEAGADKVRPCTVWYATSPGKLSGCSSKSVIRNLWVRHPGKPLTCNDTGTAFSF